MSDRIDLSDPDFEPTGEQLQGLANRAFAGLREANEKRLERMREEIAKARKLALRRLEEPLIDPKPPAP